MTLERLTVDMTVMHDAAKPWADRHALARRLVSYVEDGRIELAISPQGQMTDLQLDPKGKVALELRRLLALGSVTELPQLSRLSEVTFPSDTLLLGNFVEGFDEAWGHIVDSWKTHEGKPPGAGDRWHVEAHIVEARDVFVTDDGPLRAMCRRLRDEFGLPIETMTLKEAVEALGGGEQS